MSDRYVQLTVLNVIAAILLVTGIMGGPIVPAVVGGVAAGSILLWRYRRRKRKSTEDDHTRSTVEALRPLTPQTARIAGHKGL